MIVFLTQVKGTFAKVNGCFIHYYTTDSVSEHVAYSESDAVEIVKQWQLMVNKTVSSMDVWLNDKKEVDTQW